tara:strand:- start:1628 stop:2203 length:576 start_codon:yes stop_codon:yes gene_type:complete
MRKNIVIVNFLSVTTFISCILIGNKLGVSSRDIIADYPPINIKGQISGLTSNIGIILWISTSIICLFSLYIKNKTSIRELLIAGAFGSGVFAILDKLDLHQYLQNYSYSFIFISTFYFIFLLRKQITKIDKKFLIISLIFLSSSVLIDILETGFITTTTNLKVIEELLKFIGITNWMFFWLKVSKQNLLNN